MCGTHEVPEHEWRPPRSKCSKISAASTRHPQRLEALVALVGSPLFAQPFRVEDLRELVDLQHSCSGEAWALRSTNGLGGQQHLWSITAGACQEPMSRSRASYVPEIR